MDKQKISIIIIAMDEEFKYFLSGLDVDYSIINIEGEKTYYFNKNDNDYLALRGRVGKVSTAFYLGKLSETYDIKRIFNIGTSGGVDRRLKIGDIVIANKVIYHDVDATAFNYELGQVPGFPLAYECDMEYLNNKAIYHDKTFKVHSGVIASGDSFITRKNVKSVSIKRIAPMCVEMESASVGQSAYLMKVPFIVIRSISDLVFKKHNADDSVNNLDLACMNNVKVLLSIL